MAGTPDEQTKRPRRFSLGTLDPTAAWWVVASLMLLSPALIVPALIVMPYAVTVRAAWGKSPARAWRAFIVISIGIAVALAVANARLNAAGFPLELPVGDGALNRSLRAGFILINALLIAGVALLPLAALNAVHSALRRPTGAA